MPVEWSDDGSIAEQSRIERNLAGLIRELQTTARDRHSPSVAMARAWHRRIFASISAPVSYFPGGIRDSDPMEPELVDYPLLVHGPTGTHSCVAASQVPEQLRQFEAGMQHQVSLLDVTIPPSHGPLLQHCDDVLGLCAMAHGEWIRIHPFVNGNGRTARIWANWCALRYGLPAFVRLRPRPEGMGYMLAAEQSMYGRHQYMQVEMERMLVLRLTRPH